MSLKQAINKICQNIKQAEWSEADVEDYAVRPVLLALGWPDQLGIIRRQYLLNQSQVDFALCHPETHNPLVFIEVKKSEQTLEKRQDQLLTHTYKKGARMAILTNGHTWKFYYLAGKGTSSERCFYVLNLCEDGLEESVFSLKRYLRYEEIVNGQAFSVIREDCNKAHIHREIVDVWQETVNDPRLIDSLIETMEKKLKKMAPPPSRENILLFLKRLSVPPLDTSPSQGTTASPVLSATGFVLNGKRYDAKSGIAILIGVFNELIKLNPSFAERFVKSKFNRYKDRYKYLSKDRNDLQDPNPKNVRQLASGWWINRNLIIKTMDEIIQEACRIAEVGYGSDLIVHLPPGRNEKRDTTPPLISSSATGFVLNGKRYDAKSGIAILIGVFNELIKLNPSFAERFVKSKFNRYKDRYKYLSKDRNDLQDPNPKNVRQLASGWWINRNLIIKTMDEIIQEACRIAEVGYGSDLIVHLPPGRNEKRDTTPSLVSSFRGFVLNGKRYDAKSGIAILVGVLNELINLNPSFAERFAKSKFNRYKDRYKYFSKNPDTLRYPDRVKQLASGWWINRNLGIKRIDGIIREACRVAEVKYGSDLIIRLPPEKNNKQDTIPPLRTSSGFRGFVLYGRRYNAKSGTAILVGVLNELIKRNPSFAEQFVKSDCNFYRYQNRYKYLSRDRNDLPKPKRTRQLASGWWINCDLTIKMMDNLIREACRVGEVGYGSDLIVHLPPGKSNKQAPPLVSSSKLRGFVLYGESYRANTLIDTLLGVFNALTEFDSSFPQTFADSEFNLNKYNKNKPSRLSKDPDKFRYPDAVKQLKSGWWIYSSNINKLSIEKLIEKACQVFSEGKEDDKKVTYDKDLILYLPPKQTRPRQRSSKV